MQRAAGERRWHALSGVSVPSPDVPLPCLGGTRIYEVFITRNVHNRAKIRAERMHQAPLQVAIRQASRPFCCHWSDTSHKITQLTYTACCGPYFLRPWHLVICGGWTFGLQRRSQCTNTVPKEYGTTTIYKVFSSEANALGVAGSWRGGRGTRALMDTSTRWPKHSLVLGESPTRHECRIKLLISKPQCRHCSIL